jgi:hypothetical protein
MTPDLVERLVMEVEDAIGEPVRHTIRKLFPKRLDRSIADEVALAWKAPKRVLMLSNQFSRPNPRALQIGSHLAILRKRRAEPAPASPIRSPAG